MIRRRKPLAPRIEFLESRQLMHHGNSPWSSVGVAIIPMNGIGSQGDNDGHATHHASSAARAKTHASRHHHHQNPHQHTHGKGAGQPTVTPIITAASIPTISFSGSTTVTATENGTGATLTLTRSGGDLTQPLVFSYTTQGNGTDGNDYSISFNSSHESIAQFDANSSTATINIIANEDDVESGTDGGTLNLTLINPPSCAVVS